MEKLDIKIQKNGFTYKLMCRTDKVALYSQHHPRGDSLAAYEVFRVQKQGGHESVLKSGQNIVYVEKELFPRDEHFGYSAWTYKRFKGARDKYDELCMER